MIVPAITERQNTERIAEDEVRGTSIGIHPSVFDILWVPRDPLGAVRRMWQHGGYILKCEVTVVTIAVNGYDFECIPEDVAWGVALDNIPVIGVSDLL